MNNRMFGKRTLAIVASAGLVLSLAATVLADAPEPDGILITDVEISGLTVTLSGTWAWSRGCDGGSIDGDRDVGWAVDWNDPDAAGNELVTGIEVGTPTDNLVHQRPSGEIGDCGGDTNVATGPWGPISHEYTTAGLYEVCVVLYDVDIPPDSDGSHSVIAGGPDHNTDNSIEDPDEEFGEGACAEFEFTVEESEEPSAEESVLAGTGTPEQSTADTALSQSGANPIPTIAFSLILLASLATLAYANVKTVRNRS